MTNPESELLGRKRSVAGKTVLCLVVLPGNAKARKKRKAGVLREEERGKVQTGKDWAALMQVLQRGGREINYQGDFGDVLVSAVALSGCKQTCKPGL